MGGIGGTPLPFIQIQLSAYRDTHRARQANEYGEVHENESKFFAKVALPEIVPVLLDLLTHQDEDAEEDELASECDSESDSDSSESSQNLSDEDEPHPISIQDILSETFLRRAGTTCEFSRYSKMCMLS